MSHKITFSADGDSDRPWVAPRDLPGISGEELLRRTCQTLGLEAPVYGEDVHVGAGGPATGFRVRLPKWTKDVVFDTRTGEIAFDNYSDYTAEHPDVLSGKYRVGHAGRWGDIEKLDWFCLEYTRHVNAYLMETVKSQALSQGQFVQEVECTPERMVLEIDV